MWRRSNEAEPPEDEQFLCAYCDRELQPGHPWFSAEFEQGDGHLARHGDCLWFCDQEHAGLFLVDGLLEFEEDSPVVMTSPRRVRFQAAAAGVGFVLIVAANLGFYVLGFVTWIRWIWR